LRHFHLADSLPPSVPLRALGDLREFLRGVAENLAAGRTLSASDLRTLNAALMVPARQKLFQHQNGFRAELFPVRSGWPWILSRIAASLADTLTRYDRERVKICANDGCRWAYYDVTKGSTRRWCNDRTCGNRDRVRRARAAAKRRNLR
jgi:predicted RNA-binding Zn ribbon-like protein